MHGISAHARFDDIDLDAIKVFVGRQRRKISVELSFRKLKQVASIKLAATVRHLFLRDLDFENVYMA